MVSLRTIAVFLIACSAILLVIAFQNYQNAVASAKAIAEKIPGFEFESVGPPVETMVCGVAGVALLVAGTLLLLGAIRSSKKGPQESSLL